MSDESADLQTYRVQLEQVEAALVGDPDNEELLKLKQDLVVSKVVLVRLRVVGK